MKKKILIIILAVLIGMTMAFLTLYKYKPFKENLEDTSLTILQAGVYKDYQNALKQQSDIDGSIIIKENDCYIVIVGASLTNDGLIKLESMFNSQNIHYYKKEKTIKSNKEILKYNLLLEKTDDTKSISFLNHKILESINDEYIN